MRRFLACILLLLSLTAAAQTADSIFVDAVALVSNGQYSKAGEQFRLLVKAQPENDAAWYYLAITEIAAGQVDDAIAHLKHAIALDSRNYWYQRRLADLYQFKGQDDLVIGLYENILKEFPDKTNISFDLLSLYLKQGRFQDAQTVGMTREPAFATQCVGCGKCEQHCPQSLPIRELLKEADKALRPFPFRVGIHVVRKFLYRKTK